MCDVCVCVEHACGDMHAAETCMWRSRHVGELGTSVAEIHMAGSRVDERARDSEKKCPRFEKKESPEIMKKKGERDFMVDLAISNAHDFGRACIDH